MLVLGGTAFGGRHLVEAAVARGHSVTLFNRGSRAELSFLHEYAEAAGGQPMNGKGLDLHKRESQLCVRTDAGEVVEHRIVTSWERFTAMLGGRPGA